MPMTHIERRKGILQAVMKAVGKAGLIKMDKLEARLCVETGCSMKAAAEYIKVLILADELDLNDGFVELKRQKVPALDSA